MQAKNTLQLWCGKVEVAIKRQQQSGCRVNDNRNRDILYNGKAIWYLCLSKFIGKLLEEFICEHPTHARTLVAWDHAARLRGYDIIRCS